MCRVKAVATKKTNANAPSIWRNENGVWVYSTSDDNFFVYTFVDTKNIVSITNLKITYDEGADTVLGPALLPTFVQEPSVELVKTCAFPRPRVL